MRRMITKAFWGITAAGLLMLGAGGAWAQNLNTPSVGRALTKSKQPRVNIADQQNRQLPQSTPSDPRDDAYSPDAISTYKINGGINEAAPANDNNPYSGPDTVAVPNDAAAMQVPPGIPAVEPPIGTATPNNNGNNQETPANASQPNTKPDQVQVEDDAEAMQVPPGTLAVEPPVGSSARVFH